MINYYKYMFIVVTGALSCSSPSVSSTDSADLYGEDAPLSVCISFEEISEIYREVEYGLSQCVTFEEKISVLKYAVDALALEDGKGGITQQGKYAEMLRASYITNIYAAYEEIINLHHSGERTLKRSEAMEIGNFLEGQGDSRFHDFFLYARQESPTE